MPAKGTKKVKAHKRKHYLINDPITGLKIEDPFREPTKVRTHYRKKPKKKRK